MNAASTTFSSSSFLTAGLSFLGAWTAVNAVFWLLSLFKRKRALEQETDTTSDYDDDDAAAVATVTESTDCEKFRFELASPFHLRITTTVFNKIFMRWSQNSAPSDNRNGSSSSRTANSVFDGFYGLGVYAALTSMTICLAVLLYASVQILVMGAGRFGYGGSAINSHISQHMWTMTSDPLNKRQQAPPYWVQQETTRMRYKHISVGHNDSVQLLRPVIPGLTLPLGHIWYYMIALIICAVVHELGHALAAAACARVCMRKIGIFVLGLYPGAFVDLPREQLEKQSLSAQMRVVCAGVWHNAVTALVAWLLVYYGGLGLIFSAAGWRKVADGVVVVDVSQSSPLYGRIPLLSTISRIDDVILSPTEPLAINSSISDRFSPGLFGSSPIARWTKALTDTNSNCGTAAAGFCVRARENMDDGLCCEMTAQFPLGESPDADIYCFDPYSSSQLMAVPPMTDETMCFNLKAVLEKSDLHRCRSHLDCSLQNQTSAGLRIATNRLDSLCVLPSSPFADSRVARIYFRMSDSSDNEEQLIIYAGSLASLWLDVQVSSLRPRWPWLPYRLPSWTESLLQYVLSFSLAFCLLNAVPAWYLDGDHALRLLLLIACESRNDKTDSSVGSRNGGKETQTETKDGDDQDSVDNLDPNKMMSMSSASKRIYKVATAATTGLLIW
ncbi:hypothetical protein LPJ64_006345, partial [Coemansia asiatica]